MNEEQREQLIRYHELDEQFTKDGLIHRMLKLEKDIKGLRGKVEANIPVERIEGIQDEIDKSFKAHIDNQLKSTDSLFPSIEDHNALKAEVEELKIDTKDWNKISTHRFEGHSRVQTVEDVILKLEAKVSELERRQDTQRRHVGFLDWETYRDEVLLGQNPE